MTILDLIQWGLIARMIILFICSVGFIVFGCVCQHEIWFHRQNGLTGAMRNAGFAWGIFLMTFAGLTLIGALGVSDVYLVTRFVANNLLLASLLWFLWTCWRVLQEMVKAPDDNQ